MLIGSVWSRTTRSVNIHGPDIESKTDDEQYFQACRKPERTLNDCVFSKLVSSSLRVVLVELMVEPTKEDPRIPRRAGPGSREEIAHLYTSPEVIYASDSYGKHVGVETGCDLMLVI